MKKMETSEPVDEYESCRSSVISDLDELEANLYSYVHHERNSCFNEELSTVLNVTSLEEVGQRNDSSGEDVALTSSSFTSGYIQSTTAKENCSKGSESNKHGGSADSDSFMTGNDSGNICSVESVNVPAQKSGKKAKNASGYIGSRDSSPSILEVSSSDDCDSSDRNLSKYILPSAASTPFREYVVIDDSDDDVQIELERVNVKPKKKERKKSQIKADIQINTRNTIESISLDIDEDAIFSEKENIDSLLYGHDHENSQHESTLCKSWTPQMAQFYDESWGGERIDVDELLRTMSDDGWKVDLSDEFGFMTKKIPNQRYFGGKSKAWCTQCRQKGHYKNDCSEKTQQPRCHRCGSSKHQEYSCNQKICLTCGRFRSSLVAVCHQCHQWSLKKCSICQQCGHPPGCCPDLWRRFHATILPGEIVTPQKVKYKDPKNTYCCNCASRGHHVYQCKKNNFSDYTPMNPRVTSYMDPEVLVNFQNDCSYPSANWESVGAVAPDYQNGDRGRHNTTYDGNKRPKFVREMQARGIKRPKTADNQQKSKIRKLNEDDKMKSKRSAPNLESTTAPSKKPGKPEILVKNKIKKSTSIKIKKTVKPKKESNKKDKCMRPVDNVKNQGKNSKLNKKKEHKNGSTTRGPPTNTGMRVREATASGTTNGFVERVVVLSPGHLRRIESDEGKEILKYVTDQFKGVTARVDSNPSRVLRLVGAGNNIDHIKENLFDILNNKYRLDELKQSLNAPGNSIQVKKRKKRTHNGMVRSKNRKKKFLNAAHQNNQLEMRTEGQAAIATDLRVNINKIRYKKKLNENHKWKWNYKNGKRNKYNHQGNYYNRRVD